MNWFKQKREKIPMNRLSLSRSLIVVGIMFIFIGIFMVFFSMLLSTIQLNSSSGDFARPLEMYHVLWLRYGTSSAFFALGGLDIITGYLYQKKIKKRLMVITSFFNQPYIALGILVLSILWILQAMEPDGGISQFFAKMLNLDVNDPIDALQYGYIISKMPKLELLLFSLGCLAMMPFSTRISNLILAQVDFRLRKKGRRAAKPRPNMQLRFQRKANSYMIWGGIILGLFAAVSYAIGHVMAIGLDITVILINFNVFKFPTIPFKYYKLYMSVIPAILISTCAYCIIASIGYRKKPEKRFFRVLAWIGSIIVLLIPFYGLYFGLHSVFSLWYTRPNLPKKTKRVDIPLVEET